MSKRHSGDGTLFPNSTSHLTINDPVVANRTSQVTEVVYWFQCLPMSMTTSVEPINYILDLLLQIRSPILEALRWSTDVASWSLGAVYSSRVMSSAKSKSLSLPNPVHWIPAPCLAVALRITKSRAMIKSSGDKIYSRRTPVSIAKAYIGRVAHDMTDLCGNQLVLPEVDCPW